MVLTNIKPHPMIFDAKYTTYWTSKRIQFNFFLYEIASWNGEIPLNASEISQKLNYDYNTIQRFISSAIHNGLLIYREGKLFLDKMGHYTKNNQSRQQTYVQHLKFVRSTEFQNLHIHTQRFILELIRNNVHNNHFFHMKKKNLYHLYKHSTIKKSGKFNIYSKVALNKTLEEVEKFFNVQYHKEGTKDEIIVIHGSKETLSKKDVVPNQGKIIWVKKKLEELDFPIDLISEEIIIEMIKIIESFIQDFGINKSLEFFTTALKKLANSIAFSSKLLKGDNIIGIRYDILSLMQDIETEYAEQLCLKIEKAKKMELWATECIVQASKPVFQKIRHACEKSVEEIEKKLYPIEKRWEKRVKKEKDPLHNIISNEELYNSMSNIIKHMKYFSSFLKFQLTFKKIDIPKSEIEPMKNFFFHNWLIE